MLWQKHDNFTNPSAFGWLGCACMVVVSGFDMTDTIQSSRKSGRLIQANHRAGPPR